jgi:hypothetical protein
MGFLHILKTLIHPNEREVKKWLMGRSLGFITGRLSILLSEDIPVRFRGRGLHL